MDLLPQQNCHIKVKVIKDSYIPFFRLKWFMGCFIWNYPHKITNNYMKVMAMKAIFGIYMGATVNYWPIQIKFGKAINVAIIYFWAVFNLNSNIIRWLTSKNSIFRKEKSLYGPIFIVLKRLRSTTMKSYVPNFIQF